MLLFKKKLTIIIYLIIQTVTGSAHSSNGSSSCSKISKSNSSCDSNRSVAGSSERDSDSGCTGDSDVEILSNPSQSSIEVLEYNATRKNSEERRLSDTCIPSSMMLSLDSMADRINRMMVGERTDVEQANIGALDRKTVLSQAHLTESSSSGSVTDSICTSYEQSSSNSPQMTKSLTQPLNSSTVPPNGDAKRSPTKKAAAGTPNNADTSMISSMIGNKSTYMCSLTINLKFRFRTLPIYQRSYVAQPTIANGR